MKQWNTASSAIATAANRATGRTWMRRADAFVTATMATTATFPDAIATTVLIKVAQ